MIVKVFPDERRKIRNKTEVIIKVFAGEWRKIRNKTYSFILDDITKGWFHFCWDVHWTVVLYNACGMELFGLVKMKEIVIGNEIG